MITIDIKKICEEYEKQLRNYILIKNLKKW